MKTNRRTFLCGAFGALAVPMIPGCAVGPSIRAERQDDILIVELSRWPEGQDVVLARPREGAPAVLVRDGENIRAYSSVCTHRGCIVRPEETHLQCPCHGAQFSFEGEVIKGPAKEPLPELTVERDGDQLLVQLQSLIPE